MRIAHALFLGSLVAATRQASAQVRVSAPGQYAGYSEATYDGYVREARYVTMRDGVRLAVDLYRPTRQGAVHTEKLPVVWTHHRYNRAFMQGDRIIDYVNGFGRGIDKLVHHGYVIAAVDTRGGGASFGTQQGFFSPDETRDAYEITEWLATQPWSTGKIGMTGRSYLGITQLMAASTKPPHLVAIFPEMYVFEWYPFIYPGGIYRDDFFSNWQTLTKGLDSGKKFSWGPLTFEGVAPVDGPSGMAQRDSAIAGHQVNRDMFEMWGSVPYRNSKDPISGKEIHAERGPATYLEAINASKVAVYGLAGWFDAFPREAFLLNANLTTPRKLVVGPWFHGQTDGFDLAAERLRWFDYWLKRIDNGIMKEPPIRYFVVDAPAGREWRTTRRWPLPQARPVAFRFTGESSKSIGGPNDRRMSRTVQNVPGADTLHVDTTASVGTSTRWAATYGGPAGYPDLAANDAKGMTYTTALLANDTEVIGHPVVHLWVTSSTRDFDAIVYLEDIAPDGRSTYVTEGVLRASHRKQGKAPYDNLGLPWNRSFVGDAEPLPDEPTELTFDLYPTAKRFKAGHRIRLTIQGADRDTFRKVNGAPTVVIYRDFAHQSRLVLPIVP